MRLIRLDLNSVGPFDTLSVDLTGRLVGVAGANGSGKSSLLSAIFYAVTGDLGRLGRKKAANVLRRDDSVPSVRLTFLPDDAATDPAVIVRTLPTGAKDGARKLAYKDRVWTAMADVEEKFTSWTGLSKKALGDVVFVAQGKLDEVVTAPAAQRADVLHRAFGVDAASKIFDACRDHLARLPQADTANLATLRVQAAEALARAAEAEAELAKTPIPDPEAEKAARSVIAAYQASEAARSANARAEAVVEAVRRNAPVEPTTARTHAELVPAAQRLLGLWAAYRDLSAKADDARRRYEQADRWLHSITPVPDPGTQPVQTAEHTDLSGRRHTLAAVVACQVGDVCPVCSGPFDPDLLDRDQAAAQLRRLEQLDQQHAASIDVHRRRHQLYTAFRSAVDVATVAVDDAVAVKYAAEQARDAAVRPDTSEAELRRAVEEARRTDAEWAAYDSAVAVYATRLQRAEADLVRNPPAPANDPTTFTAAQETLRREADRRVAYSAAKATAAAVRSAADAQVAAVAKAEAVQQVVANTAIWRDRVELVRAAFARDAAPADAAASCLEAIAGDLNTRLGHLAARFRVRVQHDGELLVEYRDGTRTKTITPDLLSGGEGCVLGLAWRLALLDKYAPKVGLLCLDEPTTGLDAERVMALKSALEAWRPHGSDRQFVIVTHERKLLSAFDAVVDLGAG